MKVTFLLGSRPLPDDGAAPDVQSQPAVDRPVDGESVVALCWQARLCRELGLVCQDVSGTQLQPDDTNLPIGRALPFEQGMDMDETGTDCLRADPVYLIPDRDTAVLMPPESLLLQRHEVDRLVEDLNAFMQDDGMVIHAPQVDRWYLCGEALPSMGRLPPAQLAFSHVGPDVSDATASDDAGARRRLKTLASELEMTLYTHPVNEARRQQNRPTVSGLHVWGSRHALLTREPPSGFTLLGTDPWLRCVATTARIPLQESRGFDELLASTDATSEEEPAHLLVLETLERTHLLAGNQERALEARRDFEARWVRPATLALQQGVVSEVRLCHDDGQVTVERARRGWALPRFVRRLLAR